MEVVGYGLFVRILCTIREHSRKHRPVPSPKVTHSPANKQIPPNARHRRKPSHLLKGLLPGLIIVAVQL